MQSAKDLLGGSESITGSLASSAAGLELFRINVEVNGSRVVKELKDLGFNYTLDEISKKVDKRVAKILNTLTLAAVNAAKSTVPVRGQDLRDNHIKATGSNGINDPGR